MTTIPRKRRFMLPPLMTAAFLATASVAAENAAAAEIRVALIGADTSHAPAYTALINDANADGPRAQVQVTTVFPGGSDDIPASRDRVPLFTEQLEKAGLRVVPNLKDAVADVDAFLLESVDGRVHLEQFRSIACGKPVFVDKPAAASTADFLQIMRIAEATKTPFFSASALRFCPEIKRVLADDAVGELMGASTSTPFQKEPHHPDLFWYAIHGVEALDQLLGPGCETVRRLDSPAGALVVGSWSGGRQGTVWAVATGDAAYSFTRYGTKKVAAATGFSGYSNLVEEICQFFVTKKPPVAPQATLQALAIMEAADESAASAGAPVALKTIIERAEQKVDDRGSRATGN